MNKLQAGIYVGTIFIVLIIVLIFWGVIPGLRQSGTSVALTFWGTEPTEVFEPAITAYERANRDSSIAYVRKDAATYEAELINALATGRGPDMWIIPASLLARNSEKHLPQVLEALASFPEVVVLDTGSQDSTLEIAKRFPNVSLHSATFNGFGPLHNLAAEKAKHDWILCIDSDEVVTPQLATEIHSLSLDEGSVYSFPFHNYFNGKWIRWCGWYPDRHIRLYNRRKTRFTNAYVHEGIITDGLQEKRLNGPVIHYSYGSISDFLTKMQRYSDLFAEENHGKKSSSVGKAILHGLAAFIRSYFLKRGFLGGYEGFIISTYNANTAFYKYLKLYEKNRGGR